MKSVRALGVLLLFLLFGQRAYAFDPFTAAAALGAGANALSGLTDAVGELGASADSFSELYSEIDEDAQVSEDGKRLLEDVRETEALASEIGYSKDEIAELGNTGDLEKLSQTLHAMTQAVRAGKRVGKLALRIDQKAKLAQLETAATSREQLIATYEQIRLARERELRELKEHLKAQKEERNQILALKKEEYGMGGRQFGHSGVLTFPKTDSVLEEALKVAILFRKPLLSLLLFVFGIRALYLQFGFSHPGQFGHLAKDVMLCCLLLFIFPDLVRVSVGICQGLANQVGVKSVLEIEPGKLDFPLSIGLTVKSRILIEWLFAWIKFGVYVAAQFVSSFGLAFLILIFPLIIFCSQMLGFTVAWPLFFGGFLSVCLWPLFWNATGSLVVLLWHRDAASISDQLATVLFSLLQFLSPLVAVAVLRGQGALRASHQAGRMAASAITGGLGEITHQVRGVTLGALGQGGGGAGGRVLGYGMNQGVGRMQAAYLASTEKKGFSRMTAGAAGLLTNRSDAPNGGKASWLKATGAGFKPRRFLSQGARTRKLGRKNV